MSQNVYQKRILEWEEKYGGLSPDVQKKIDKLVEQHDETQNIKQGRNLFSITNGTKLIREFKGKTYFVVVISGGYEFDGKKYKSLSAIANEITGKHWNGKKFFGVAS